MTNNDILKKLRVALKLRDDDVIAILKLVDFNLSKSELNALYQKEDHPNYMACGDQILRRFLDGLIVRNRGKMEKPPMKVRAEWIKCTPLPVKGAKANARNG